MLVSVQSQADQVVVALPEDVGGAHWIADAQGVRLAYLEGRDGVWHLDSGDDFTIHGLDGKSDAQAAIDPARLAVVNVDGLDGQRWSLIFQPEDVMATKSTIYGFSGDIDLTIGRADDNSIVYPNSFVSSHHLKLSFREGMWQVAELGSSNGVFVNGKRVPYKATVGALYGDVVRVLGMHITLGNGLFACNNPGSQVVMRKQGLVEYHASYVDGGRKAKVPERELFYPALRFARTIERKKFSIDAPPNREKEDKTSLLQRMGPSMLMGFASLASACVFISMMADQGSSMLRAVPMIAMAVSMLAGSVIWPIVNARHQESERQKNESIRRGAYSQYLSSELSKLSKEEELQREILRENRISVEKCMNMALTGDPHLMDRTSLHADYLDVRIGLGDEPFEADIKFPDAHFTVEDDDLREEVETQAQKDRSLKDVPLAFPLIEKHVMGVIGDPSRTHEFSRGLVVQIAALSSYEDVKIVLLCDEQQRQEWSFAKHLPHCFSDDKQTRYFACGLEEAAEVGMNLERILEERRLQDRFDGREAQPYYVVVCASENLIDKANIVRAIVEERDNKGISLIALANAMKDLPKECRSVIGLDENGAYLLDRDDPMGIQRRFKPDIAVSEQDAEEFAYAIAKQKLDLEVEKQKIPSRLGFLEMYGAGSVEHFSIASRWRESNASASLAACVGADAQGEPFLLNLHEKSHGPHGLIAGTTGSGKSEFIITYILSMAMTYSPDDVAFVLIDYKGGGLAKAFDNEHVRLPHLAGVITNLDGAAITRSLVSIQSELKRRQALFNEARDVVGGDNIDIYSYLDLYRQGRMTEPCPHLFIVADEFAELKQQEPEFMDELISAARIGRSLGVHLILATQKPTGVVNDQIWSNARFKVCLKVADASDSNEMIKRPDAAELQEAGRFYLLVGYNEYFALGQSGYAGTKYVPRDRFAQQKDDSVTLISDTGRSLVSVKPQQGGASKDARPESVVLLAAIRDAAETTGVFARQLWLEPIPAIITIDALTRKYQVPLPSEHRFVPIPIIGEYDDPNRQHQGLLSCNLAEGGNTLIYGTTDSGVESALMSAVYSLLKMHDSQSLNVYALDFGSESLKAFSGAPQVGDVVGTTEDEKINRFFDFFDGEFTRRRAILSEYGGSFLRYVKDHADLPAIVVVINDLGALLEGFQHLEDRVSKFIREAGRSGIFLLASAAGTTSVRMRMRQNFRQVLAVNLADSTDYGMLFGPMRGLPQPKGFGRGLVQLEEGVFEFQAAHLTDGGDEFGCAQALSAELADSARLMGEPFAPAIPTAPEAISPEMARMFEPRADFLPYGVYDDDLSVAGFDFSDSPMARVQFQRKKDGLSFLKAFLAAAQHYAGWEIVLLDMVQMLGEEKPSGCVFATRQDEYAKSYLTQNVFERKARRASDSRLLVVITGVTDFVNRGGIDFSGPFKEFLREIPDSTGVNVLLVDASTNTSYTYEDWFKANLTNKDGLWVGPGIESQSVISITYSSRLAPDGQMDATRGYEVDGGATRLVHLVSLPEEEDPTEELIEA